MHVSLGDLSLGPRGERGGTGTKLALCLPQGPWGFSAPLAQGSGGVWEEPTAPDLSTRGKGVFQ